MGKGELRELYKGTILLLIRTIILLFYNLKIHGLEKIPNGKKIIAANHTSFSDPVFILAATNKKIYFLVKHYIQPTEGFRNSYLGKFFKSTDQVILNHGKADKETYKKALEVLDKNWILGIFPEGTRSGNGKLQKLEEGIARVSYKANAPIVPIYIKGAYESWPRTQKFPKVFKPIELYIKEPIQVDYSKPKKEELKRVMDNLEKKLSGSES
jgi:1-acyl-sn-glycerol-3-phosphate acyltransferase